MATDHALAKSLVLIGTDTNYENIMIGNSKFTDDVWDLRPFIQSRTVRDSHKYLDFKYISSNEIKYTIKQYMYYKLAKIKPKTARDYLNGCLPSFIEYCNNNGIESLKVITSKNLLEYNFWLKSVKKITNTSGCKKFHIVEEIIKIGNIKGWAVPQINILNNISSTKLWNISIYNSKQNKYKPIPEDVFNQILYHAIHDEKDILTKAGIIIQSQTGLRINEILSICEGCVKTTSDGYDYMEVELSKTEKGEPIIHKVFINELSKDVIKELTLATAKLRKESGLKELFLIKYYKIRVLKSDRWSCQRLSNFIKRWDIRDNKGNLYPLKSHQFRATFVRELVKRKVPIAMIMEQYSHVSIEMTSHYLSLQAEEVCDIYSDMILNPNSKIAGLRAKEIKDKLNTIFNGKTEEEIDAIIDDLASTMSFNPLPTGVCLYDFRRGNCTDGDGCFFYNCPNYITEVQFLPILKSELNLLKKEMARLKALDREREWQRQYIKYKHLKPLVESLEVQKDET